MTNENFVENYYQGIYVTETIMGNPNGDFIDNSPRNIDGNVFTTDKCIKYNVRKYIHDNLENVENNENIVFFFPRLIDEANKEENKFQTRDDVFKNLFDGDFEELKNNSPDVRMFGGTFSFKNKDSKQIYGPIQISYGLDLNNAQIKRLQIGAPFSTESGKQTTTGTESVVDDAVISYDIIVNPNNHPGLLLNDDLELFKKSLWFGTNLRRSTSKKTESKLMIFVKFKNEKINGKTLSFNIGELNKLISVEKDMNSNDLIEIDCLKLKNKLESYIDFIESIDAVYDKNEVKLNNFFTDEIVNVIEPKNLL